MKIPPHDSDRISKRAFEILGGKEAFLAAADNELAEINRVWNQNVESTGRILRAHLFVEHYLSLYLERANPRLGSLSGARITFAQKVSLLDKENSDIAAIIVGIKRLNTIRNRLAHNLSTHVSNEDAEAFLSCARFAALRAARATIDTASDGPLNVLEDFARHTGMVLTYEFSAVSQAIEKAIDEVHIGKGVT